MLDFDEADLWLIVQDNVQVQRQLRVLPKINSGRTLFVLACFTNAGDGNPADGVFPEIAPTDVRIGRSLAARFPPRIVCRDKTALSGNPADGSGSGGGVN
jgi:hypothetical protein